MKSENEELIESMSEDLGNPAYSLQAYGTVIDQQQDGKAPYSPTKITKSLQSTILGYISDTPRDELGHTKFLACLKYRQGGASTTGALAFYAKAQYNPGWEHITAADTKDRADYLFERVMVNHNSWPEQLRVPLRNANQQRMLSWTNDSKMLVVSGRTRGAGIGKSPSSFSASEVPLWENMAEQWNYLWPAIANRENHVHLQESTPFPMHEPSAEWYKNLCGNARSGNSRFLYSFQPFWDGKLNRRPWHKGDVLTTEEQRLFDRYGPYGLEFENIAFRRYTMDNDPEIRRNPELFRIFYPFDDVTCWISRGGGVIHPRHLERNSIGLREWDWNVDYMEYIEPQLEAKYVIGVDPSGYGTNDHASFTVLDVWREEVGQVAQYASDADPPEVAQRLFDIGRRYNWAMIVPERNGVGLGIIALLEAMNYPNLYYDRNQKPGIHKHNETKLLSDLIDMLQERLVIRDRETFDQLQDYRADRAVQKSVKSQLLGIEQKNRRDRHHWDRVSSLLMAVQGALESHAPRRHVDPVQNVVRPFSSLTLSDLERYDAQRESRLNRGKKPKRRMARYRRRR